MILSNLIQISFTYVKLEIVIVTSTFGVVMTETFSPLTGNSERTLAWNGNLKQSCEAFKFTTQLGNTWSKL